MRLQDLPKVDELAAQLATAAGLPRLLAISIARDAIETTRAAITAGDTSGSPHTAGFVAAHGLLRSRPTRLINATGVLLHTNLGRAPLAPAAVDMAGEAGSSYGNIEFDTGTGKRGKRARYANELLVALSGAEASLVVNNNAAALLLALAAIAGGGNAVVSRGEEIEIGGSFRLPELMEASGANLVEVGTTNRTRLTDYAAVASAAAAILKVHPSNYRLEGFAESVSYGDLADLAHGHGVPFIADIGSGLLDTRVPWLAGPPPPWLAAEPGVRETLEAGADVVIFSGDKLLGGPQCGIAVGRAALIEMMAVHPLARAVRIDGPTHAALAATLELYADDRGAEIPFWAMVAIPYDILEARHRRLLTRLESKGAIVAGESLPGAGSVPGETIPSPNLRLDGKADELWAKLLQATPPVLARRREGHLFIDLRTVDPTDDDVIVKVLTEP